MVKFVQLQFCRNRIDWTKYSLFPLDHGFEKINIGATSEKLRNRWYKNVEQRYHCDDLKLDHINIYALQRYVPS